MKEQKVYISRLLLIFLLDYVLQTANSRFVPRTMIETSAILSLDEDIKLNSDEVCYTAQ